MDFEEDAYLKLVGVSGDYHYGYIQEVTENGLHLLICLHEEGTSAVEYETQTGSLSKDWSQMLTDTEVNIISGLADGESTKVIAEKLILSPSTVRAHIRSLRLKLQLDDRNQLIAFAEGMNQRLKGDG